MPRKGSKEYNEMIKQRQLSFKKEHKAELLSSDTPLFVSVMLLGSCFPQSYFIYDTIWAELGS